MSTAIAEVYFAGKSCLILRPSPIEHEFDPVIYKDAAYITDYDTFAAAADAEAAPFPIEKEVIEGYFDASETPAYLRMADLLEEVRQNPPRDLPFSEGYQPHFNWLKFFALIGVHMMHAVRFDPKRLKKLVPGFADFAGRIYGYIAKAYLPKKQRQAAYDNVRRFL